ncbi:MAG: HIT family protein [Patescibacteria group bacterium]
MCVFCKIINGEIPAHKVYEDEKTLAFLDIKPINPGHTLIIPKNHYANLSEIPEIELADLIIKVKKIAALLKEKLGFTDYTISENNGPLAGQSVSHFHFHIIPRFANDILTNWDHKERRVGEKEYEPGEAEEIIKKLQS